MFNHQGCKTTIHHHVCVNMHDTNWGESIIINRATSHRIVSHKQHTHNINAYLLDVFGICMVIYRIEYVFVCIYVSYNMRNRKHNNEMAHIDTIHQQESKHDLYQCTTNDFAKDESKNTLHRVSRQYQRKKY